jgi:hypothetical protein
MGGVVGPQGVGRRARAGGARDRSRRRRVFRTRGLLSPRRGCHNRREAPRVPPPQRGALVLDEGELRWPAPPPKQAAAPVRPPGRGPRPARPG